jgi:hypothetical protein
MFHNLMRKATEHASPTMISGVAFTSVSEKTPISPKAARPMWA